MQVGEAVQGFFILILSCIFLRKSYAQGVYLLVLWMKKIGIGKMQTWSSRPRALWLLRLVYVGILVLSFSFFALYARLTGWLFANNKIDIFQDLDQLSFLFWVVDPELSKQLLTLDAIMKAYWAGANVLQTKEREIFQLREYARSHKQYLVDRGFGNYERIFVMLDDAWELRDEILSLLWKEQRFNYLVPLQNSNEARPNGWFFGSFAFVGLSGGHIVDLQVVDSYLPDYIAPETRMQLPAWMAEVLGSNSGDESWGNMVGFIAGNKFGFTDKDGKNLKLLYEKIFHTEFDPERKEKLFKAEEWGRLFQQNIKGVVFLDSEFISYLLPSFRSKAWEWQFINANIDLIRGENRSNKKELYIQDLQQYLKQNVVWLVRAGVNNVQHLLHRGYVNIYLSNVSGQMWDFLDRYDLTTVYDSDFLYFWNINTAYNKSDWFLKKQVEIQNSDWTVVLSTDLDKLDISGLKTGKYQASIHYTFDVPKTYQDEMLALQKKYRIKMTDREKYILVLQKQTADPHASQQRWSTRELIYVPFGWRIGEVSGDMVGVKEFQTEFAQGLTYLVRIEENPQSRSVQFELNVP